MISRYKPKTNIFSYMTQYSKQSFVVALKFQVRDSKQLLCDKSWISWIVKKNNFFKFFSFHYFQHVIYIITYRNWCKPNRVRISPEWKWNSKNWQMLKLIRCDSLRPVCHVTSIKIDWFIFCRTNRVAYAWHRFVVLKAVIISMPASSMDTDTEALTLLHKDRFKTQPKIFGECFGNTIQPLLLCWQNSRKWEE